MEQSVQSEYDEEDKSAGLRKERKQGAEQRHCVKRTTLPCRPTIQFETLEEQGRQQEECGEHVLAAHHPTDGLHMDWQYRKADGYRGARSGTSRRPPQQEKEEPDVERVEYDIAEVVAEGIAEPKQSGVDRPTQVAYQKWLFSRKISDEDFANAGEDGVFVVEIRVCQ